MTLVSNHHTGLNYETDGSLALRPDAGDDYLFGLDREIIAAFLFFEVDASALPSVPFGPIGQTVYSRTYSRPLPHLDRKEVWAETVRRVVLGNLGFAPARIALDNEAIELFALIYTLHTSPAGRHLWVTGTGSTAVRNCFLAGYEARPSVHAHWLGMQLFLGGGVGGNYSDDLTAITEPILGSVSVRIGCAPSHQDFAVIQAAAGCLLATSPAADEIILSVPDSREGWCDTWAQIIDTPTREGDFKFFIDVSEVRPYGAPLTSGGQASGPAPLVEAIIAIAGVVASAQGRRLSGMDYMDIDHAIASSVVAGGTRRSARMSLKHWADQEIFVFINCKADSSKHWSTNISVEVDNNFAVALDEENHPLHSHANAVLSAVAEGMARDGEPGFVDTEAHSVGEPIRIRGVNPCAEVSLNFWESCNIGSVNLDAFGTDFDGASRAFELMARFLYRATMKPHADERSAAIEAVNRRIGLGVLGFQGWCAAYGVKLTGFADNSKLRSMLTKFRIITRRAADAIADSLGTPYSVKVMAIAPTGSISQLSGSTAGIHPVSAKHFIRRVRYSDNDPQLPILEQQGFVIVKDIYAANTMVVEFPVRDSILDRFPEHLIEDSSEVSFDQFMAMVKAVQDTLLAGTDGNAISATAQIPAGMDPLELEMAMRKHIGSGLKGMTVFPEISRPLAPIQPLTKEQYEAVLREVDESARFYLAAGDSNDGQCSTGACPVR